jgi:hypothetical protein
MPAQSRAFGEDAPQRLPTGVNVSHGAPATFSPFTSHNSVGEGGEGERREGQQVFDIGLAVCRETPTMDIHGENALVLAALERRGLRACTVYWDDETAFGSADSDAVDEDERRHLPRFRCVMMKSTWDYHERVPEFRAWLERLTMPHGYGGDDAEVTLLVNPRHTIEYGMRKDLWLPGLVERGVNVAFTQFIGGAHPFAMTAGGGDEELSVESPSIESAEKVIREVAAHPSAVSSGAVIVKPAISADAWETKKFSFVNEGWLRQAATHALSIVARPGQRAMVQPFYREVQERGEVSVIFINGELVHAALSKTSSPVGAGAGVDTAGADEFRIHEAFGGSRQSHTLPNDQRVFAENVLTTTAALVRESAERCAIEDTDPIRFARVDFFLVGSQEGEEGVPLLTEIEMIDPDLFSCVHPPVTEKLADMLQAVVSDN